MKLEVGKRYKTRDGRITSPLEAEKHEVFSFSGYVGGYNRTWKSDGFWLGDEDGLDLVEEYVEENTKMKLEENVVYQLRNGDSTVLSKVERCSMVGSNGYFYNSKGQLYSDETSEYDIVDVVKAPKNIDFETQVDIWKHLLDGGAVEYKEEGTIYKIIDGSVKRLEDGQYISTLVGFINPELWCIYVEPPKWNDFKIKNEVLCRVNKGVYECLVLINSMEGGRYADVDGALWDHAEPVTLNDITPYIWECE